VKSAIASSGPTGLGDLAAGEPKSVGEAVVAERPAASREHHGRHLRSSCHAPPPLRRYGTSSQAIGKRKQ
jgi:hypothetical protein